MKVKLWSNRPVLIHAWVECHDCDWTNEGSDPHLAQRKAYDHAKKTGHMVLIETGYSQVYNPKNSE